MRSLPLLPAFPLPEPHCDAIGQGIALPCSDSDLVLLVQHLDRSRKGVKKILRTQPSILMFAAAAYYSRCQRSADSFCALIDWTQHNLLDFFGGPCQSWSHGCPESERSLAAEWVQPGSKRQRREWMRQTEAFRRVKTNKEIRRCLVAVLMAFSGQEKKAAKRWVRQVVGKQICFSSKKSSKKSGLLKQSLDGIDIEALFRQRIRLQELEHEYENQRLEDKLSAMKELAYGASHEINNPLANISTRAQVLLTDEVDSERRHKLAVIYEQALRAHEMISDLMLFARPPAVECNSTNVRLWLAGVIREFESSLQAVRRPAAADDSNSINIRVRICSRVDRIEIDGGHLAVAMRAILQNAVDAIGDQPGTIEIHVRPEGEGWLVIAITDDGVGVSEPAKEHLFDPFYSGREAGRGLGFGLTKAWRIAGLHGGSLDLDAEYEDGARFVLKLPVSQSVAKK